MQHTTKRRWITRGSIFGGAFLALVLGIAAALFTGTAPVTGGVDSDSFAVRWDTNTNPAANTDGGATCTYTANDAGKMTLNVTKAYPGTSCLVTGRIRVNGDVSESGKITGLDLAMPTGWTAKLEQGCGETVDQFQTSPGSGTTVKLRVSMGDQAQPGSSGTFTPSDGVKVAPVSQDAPLTCTP